MSVDELAPAATDTTAADTGSDGMVAGRRRVIVITGGVAIVSLLAGMLLANRITSPGEAAARARAPDASNITVEVERREIRSEVITRGDVLYDGATDVVIGTSGLTTTPVVTGQVPAVGSTIDAGAVILQVVGRPVLALTGDVPAYRSLTPGLAGPDVLQLKAALVALGLNPGNVTSDLYDQQTGAAVAQLYTRAGYAPPVADETIAGELEMARETMTSADEAVAAAQGALDAASRPPTESERLQAESLVSTAQRALSEAEAGGDPNEIAAAQEQLTIAQAQRDEALAPKDTTDEQTALTNARTQQSAARTALSEAELKAGTPLPLSEVVFLPSLPRRVDEVTVTRGKTIDGPVMRVSGADLVVMASLSNADRQLVTPGLTANLTVGDETVSGTVTEVREATSADAPGGDGGGGGEGGGGEGEGEGDGGDQGGGGDGRFVAVVRPTGLTPEQVDLIRGTNVKVTVPVESTNGEVLAVPLAALTTGSGGETRVDVQRGDEVEKVRVEVGLAAGGYAEVRAVDGSLEEGDLVVVGR